MPRTTPSSDRPRAARALAGFLVLAAGACGGGPEEEDRSVTAGRDGPSVAVASRPAEAPGRLGTARLAGRVLLEGAPPPNAVVAASSDAYCAKEHPRGVEVASVVTSSVPGAGTGLANVFVWVKSGATGAYPPPAAAVVLDQKGCAYTPRVFGIQVGQTLEIVNSDATIHNVHGAAEKNDSFNLGMPLQGQKYTRKFDRPELPVRFKCDVHGWMRAFAGVVPHPFFAVSGPDGSFAIERLPAGSYLLEAWHETLGTRSEKVTLADGESRPLSFTFASFNSNSTSAPAGAPPAAASPGPRPVS